MNNYLTTAKKYLTAFLPATIWAVIIFLFSAQRMLPSLSLSLLDFLLKKTAHMFVYAVLYFLVYRGLNQIQINKSKIWWQTLLIGLIYAASDEFHQSMTPGRTATLRDVGFDFLGMSLIILKKFKYV